MTKATGGREKDDTRVGKAERWLRNQPLTSVLIILGICIIGISEVAEHGTDILTRVGILQEKTLQLATQSAKGELSRKLVALTSRRIFWTRNYYARVKLGRPPEEVDYSWNKHLETVADWSTDLITNTNTILKYYPHADKITQFSNIHEEFKTLDGGDLLTLRNIEEDLRKQKVPETAQQKQDKMALIDKVDKATDHINYDLYMFALNESEDQAMKQK